MPVEPRRPALDLSSGVVLLGEAAPVVLVDDPAEVGAAVERGAAAIVVPAIAATAPELVDAAARTTLVLSGPVSAAHLLALDLVAAGALPGHLVVEATIVEASDAPTVAQIEEMQDAGLLVGAVLAAEADGPPEIENRAQAKRREQEDVGWEIAMCTRLLAVGVQTLRNVDPARFRRVQAVVDAIRNAAP